MYALKNVNMKIVLGLKQTEVELHVFWYNSNVLNTWHSQHFSTAQMLQRPMLSSLSTGSSNASVMHHFIFYSGVNQMNQSRQRGERYMYVEVLSCTRVHCSCHHCPMYFVICMTFLSCTLRPCKTNIVAMPRIIRAYLII